MAFNLPLPTKKFWLFAGLVVLIALGSLWYLGKNYQDQTLAKNLLEGKLSKEQTDYYNKIVARALALRSIANQSLSTKSSDGLETLALKPITNAYKLSDLSLSNKEDPSSLKLYGQSLGQILTIFSSAEPNELKIMLDAVDAKDQSRLSKLAETKNSLDGAVSKLLKLKTPKSAGSIELKLINNLAKQSELIGNMSQVFSQPLLALESAQTQYQTISEFYQLTGEINQYFRVRGVVFGPDENIKIYQNI